MNNGFVEHTIHWMTTPNQLREIADKKLLGIENKKLDEIYKNINLTCKVCPNSNYHPLKIGCCAHCGDTSAHFCISTENQRKQFNVLKTRYDYHKIIGFYRYGTGCILPRSKRSIICNQYNCGECGITKDDQKKIDIILGRIIELRKRLNLIY